MAVADLHVEIRSRRVWLMRLLPIATFFGRSFYFHFAALLMRFVVIEMKYGQNEWQRLDLWSALDQVIV